MSLVAVVAAVCASAALRDRMGAVVDLLLNRLGAALAALLG